MSIMAKYMLIGRGTAADRVARHLQEQDCEYTRELGGGCEWLFNVGGTRRFTRAQLEAVRRGALNAHPAPLPEYAGLYCHYWAIENGEQIFGATLHHLVP